MGWGHGTSGWEEPVDPQWTPERGGALLAASVATILWALVPECLQSVSVDQSLCTAFPLASLVGFGCLHSSFKAQPFFTLQEVIQVSLLECDCPWTSNLKLGASLPGVNFLPSPPPLILFVLFSFSLLYTALFVGYICWRCLTLFLTQVDVSIVTFHRH